MRPARPVSPTSLSRRRSSSPLLHVGGNEDDATSSTLESGWIFPLTPRSRRHARGRRNVELVLDHAVPHHLGGPHARHHKARRAGRFRPDQAHRNYSTAPDQTPETTAAQDAAAPTADAEAGSLEADGRKNCHPRRAGANRYRTDFRRFQSGHRRRRLFAHRKSRADLSSSRPVACRGRDRRRRSRRRCADSTVRTWT